MKDEKRGNNCNFPDAILELVKYSFVLDSNHDIDFQTGVLIPQKKIKVSDYEL